MMLKLSILLNSSVTLIIMLLNFAFKIYLAKEFSKYDLVVYYTILDVLSLTTRVFIGYKDAFTTLYNKVENKLKAISIFSDFFIVTISFISIIIIPILVNSYLVFKIENFTLSSFELGVVFFITNLVAYYGYIFLVTKHYKLISINDMLKSISQIVIILLLYTLFGFDANYQTLVFATILSGVIVLFYLLYKQHRYLSSYNIFKVLKFRFLTLKDKDAQTFFKQSILASLSYFIYGLLLFAPVFSMLNYDSTEELANFQVVARSIFFALIAVFSWPLGRFMFPEFSSMIAKKDYVALAVLKVKFVKFLAIFAIVLYISCFLFSKYFISLLFPADYIQSYEMLNVLVLLLPFMMYQNFSESVIKAVGDYKTNITIKTIGLVSFVFIYTLFEFIFDIDMASIYSFDIAVFCIFLSSLYFELKIKKSWGV